MSRSYKRHPVTKDKNYKFGKRLAVKAVRRDDGISNGKSYKKKFCSWNICDYRIYEGSFEKARITSYNVCYTKLLRLFYS